jgi:hypothetical protein
VSDAELVSLAVCQAAVGISSDRRFLGAWRVSWGKRALDIARKAGVDVTAA